MVEQYFWLSQPTLDAYDGIKQHRSDRALVSSDGHRLAASKLDRNQRSRLKQQATSPQPARSRCWKVHFGALGRRWVEHIRHDWWIENCSQQRISNDHPTAEDSVLDRTRKVFKLVTNRFTISTAQH